MSKERTKLLRSEASSLVRSFDVLRLILKNSSEDGRFTNSDLTDRLLAESGHEFDVANQQCVETEFFEDYLNEQIPMRLKIPQARAQTHPHHPKRIASNYFGEHTSASYLFFPA
jgi:hypothetical protein